MSLSSLVNDLAARIATEFNSVRTALAGKASTSHTHAAGDIASGTIAEARLPVRLAAPVATTVSTSHTIDPTAGAVHNLTSTTATLALNVAAGGLDRQVLRVATRRSTAAALTVTLNAAIALSTGLASSSIDVPANKLGFITLEYSSFLAAWVLTAYTVSA